MDQLIAYFSTIPSAHRSAILVGGILLFGCSKTSFRLFGCTTTNGNTPELIFSIRLQL